MPHFVLTRPLAEFDLTYEFGNKPRGLRVRLTKTISPETKFPTRQQRLLPSRREGFQLFCIVLMLHLSFSADDQQPSCSAKMRLDGSRPTLQNYPNCFGSRRLGDTGRTRYASNF